MEVTKTVRVVSIHWKAARGKSFCLRSHALHFRSAIRVLPPSPSLPSPAGAAGRRGCVHLQRRGVAPAHFRSVALARGIVTPGRGIVAADFRIVAAVHGSVIPARGIVTAPYGIVIPQNGIHTARQGIHTAPLGIAPISRGINPPPSGNDPAPSGIHTLPRGIHTAASGINPAAQNNNTPAFGNHPAALGNHPAAHGKHPKILQNAHKTSKNTFFSPAMRGGSRSLNAMPPPASRQRARRSTHA